MASCRSRMGTKTCRLSSMLTLTLTFFLVELIVGHVTHSLALIGDSYHMLSDVVALIVGIASLRISKLRSHKNTYGWARAEVVGALINSVFLIALCFTILTEAIERFTNPEKIEHPHVLLYVGIAGFVINLIGLLLLHGHAHGHSHGGSHSHNHASTTTTATTPVNNTESIVKSTSDKFLAKDLNEVQSLNKTTTATVGGGGGDDEEEEDKDVPSDTVSTDTEEGVVDVDAIRGKPKIKTSTQLNMRGVFLHVLGDALGSVVVIISAICIIFIEQDWKYFIDPVLSLVLVAIVLSTTIPLLRESALILLQTVPTHIKVSTLKDKLLSKVSGVLAVHEFHVWQLAGSRIIASAHIRCQSLRDYMRIAEEVKSFFHNEGIHSTTIQPEFVEFEELTTGSDCLLECGPDKTCHVDTCCARSSNNNNKLSSANEDRSSVRSLRLRNTTATTSSNNNNNNNNNNDDNRGVQSNTSTNSSAAAAATDDVKNSLNIV